MFFYICFCILSVVSFDGLPGSLAFIPCIICYNVTICTVSWKGQIFWLVPNRLGGICVFVFSLPNIPSVFIGFPSRTKVSFSTINECFFFVPERSTLLLYPVIEMQRIYVRNKITGRIQITNRYGLRNKYANKEKTRANMTEIAVGRNKLMQL